MARVLVIDDHPIDRQLLAHLLEHMHHKVLEAPSAASALDIAPRERPDLIICDIEMPGMNGIALAAALRGLPACADTPMLFYTASLHDQEMTTLARESNVFAVLTKPAEPEAIALMVSRALGYDLEAGEPLLYPTVPEAFVDVTALRLAALVRVGLDLSAREQDIDSLLQKFCHASRDVVGCAYAGVRIEAQGDEPQRSFWSGDFPGDLKATLDGWQVEPTLMKAAPEISRRSWKSPEFPLPALAAAHPQLEESLTVPLTSRGGRCGWLYFLRVVGEAPFSADEERLAVTLAVQGSLAFENAYMVEEGRRQKQALEAVIAQRLEVEVQLVEANDRLSQALHEAQQSAEARDESEQALAAAAARNRELTSLDRLKDEFIGIVSHELRTPLNAIMGFGSALTDGVLGALTEEQAPFAVKILTASERLLGLIDDLLDFGRLQAGKMRFDHAAVDLRDTVRTCVSLLQNQADTHHVTLVCELPDAVLPVWGDEQRLSQSILNLLGNALKFTPVGGTVIIRARLDAEHVVVEVLDTGIGIAARDLPKLFQRFGQIDTSATRAFSGTGLGLAIVKLLVEAHEGEVGVESEEGAGTRFWILLPRNTEAGRPVAPASPAAAG